MAHINTLGTKPQKHERLVDKPHLNYSRLHQEKFEPAALCNVLVTQILYYQFNIRVQNYTFIISLFTFRSISSSHLKGEHIDHPFPASGGSDIFSHCVPADVWKPHAPFCVSGSACHFP